MEMQELVNLFTEKSVTILILAYFMYRDFRFMDTLKNTLNTLTETMEIVRNALISKGVNE